MAGGGRPEVGDQCRLESSQGLGGVPGAGAGADAMAPAGPDGPAGGYADAEGPLPW